MKNALIMAGMFLVINSACLAQSVNTKQLGQELIDAAEKGDLSAVNRLLKAGADVNALNDKGSSALTIALDWRHTAVAKRLLAVPGIQVDHRKNESDDTPLQQAALSGDTELVKMLLAKGANANAQGLFKRTPLMWAAWTRASKPGLVKMLLAAGADVSLRDDQGKTAYDHAIEREHPQIAEIIKQRMQSK